MQGIKAMNWGMTVAGLWVVVAPSMLGYSSVTAALWNDLIVGVAVALLAAASALVADENSIRTLNWITAALGPMNFTPCFSQSAAKDGFSDKKPYPGWIASAPLAKAVERMAV